MGIKLGFDLASGAKAAADEFISKMASVEQNTLKLSEAIEKFNSKGELVSQTFKAVTDGGAKLEATLKQTKTQFELVSAKSDEATASLKAFEQQERATQAAALRNQANTAEASLSGLKGLQPGGNANQINAAEVAIQKIRAAIESGTVSYQRFQQIQAQILANPKSIIPNLTAEEASVSRALRTMVQGFDVTGDKAQRMGERISISWQGIVRLFEAQVIKRATGALQSALVDGVQSATDFSVHIAEIGTISQRSGVSSEEWSAGIRRLSAQFGNTQADVAEAAYQSLSNQVTKGADTFEFLTTALRFSKATITNAADSVNLMSSAMKSFNIPTSEAERVASVFFKTIELGRVRGSEMADTFGRIGTIAADSGVKLEEVAAAITTLTVKGMKFQDASTLISNFLLKLLRPTEEMKELFKEWGVASGQAAIATFGFSGVLQRLDEEAQKGSTRLGELFNQIRAFRGAINLTGNSFGDFQKDLAAITEGQGDFNRAVDIVMQSFGDRVRRQLNAVKVYFSEEFGDGIVQATVKISEGLGGMANVLRYTEKIFTPIVIGLVTWKAAAVGAAIATKAYTASLAAMGSTATVSAAALNGINVFTAAFSASFTVGMLIFNQDDQRRIENVVKDLEKLESLKFDSLRTLDKATSKSELNINDTKESFDNRFKIVLQYQRNNVLASEDAKKKAVQNLKEITEQTKVSSKNYFDAIGQGLKKLADDASEAKSIIKSSLKSSEEVQRKLGDSIFAERNKYASEGHVDSVTGMVVDEQKIGLIKTRITELSNLAREKFAEGTKESVDDARKLYGEVEKLTTELFDQQTKKRRTEFDEQVRRGTAIPKSYDFDPQTGAMKERYEFTVKTADLERQLKNIANEKLAAEQKLRDEKEKQLKLVQDQELREKERVKTIQQAITEIEKLRVLDDKGDPTKKFKKDPKEALAEFDRQDAIARKAAEGFEVRDRLQTLDFLDKQRLALEKEVNAAILSERSKTEQETTQMQGKAAADRFVALREAAATASSAAANEAKKLAVTIKTISEADLQGPRGVDLVFDLTNLLKAGQLIKNAKIKEDLDLVAKAAIEANEAFAGAKTKENLKKNIEALDEYIAKLKSAIEQATGKDIGDLPKESGGRQRFDELLRSRKALSDSLDIQEKAKADLESLQKSGDKMKEAIQDIPGVFGLIEQAAGKSVAPTIDSLDQIIGKIGQIIKKAEAAAEAIKNIGGVVPPPVEAGNPNGFFGGQPRYYAFGGRGSDDQLAYINRRETVMTGQATEAWSPLLRAMNAGMSPKQLSGGTVTTVGDINIQMQGDAPASQNVRNFAKGLRRAIRRGTVSLD